MSKIDYQVLREAAEKATSGEWSLEYGDGRFDGDDALIHREVAGYIPICRIEGAHPESGFDEDFQMEQQANAEFITAANPAAVLALLGELEAKDSTIAAQQHEIRMLLNALEEKPCPKCNDTGMADSGGTQPWGEPIEIECDCRQQDANTAELVSTGIITNAGE